MEVRYSGFTRRGQHKSINQDCILIGEDVIQDKFWEGHGTGPLRFGVADGISSQGVSGEVSKGNFLILHAGNSVLYQRFDDNLVALTHREEMMGGLYNAIGVKEGVEVSEWELPMKPNEVFVLKSDGIPVEGIDLLGGETLKKGRYEDDASWIKVEIKK